MDKYQLFATLLVKGLNGKYQDCLECFEEIHEHGVKSGIAHEFERAKLNIPKNSELDYEAGLNDGREEGREVGRQEGLDVGRKEGLLVGLQRGKR